uniref:Uncharacterized protein n=1 Tax=Cacopsylla melanoneura TaxID=428564 RepID=A0A8D9AS52_9HEMI
MYHFFSLLIFTQHFLFHRTLFLHDKQFLIQTSQLLLFQTFLFGEQTCQLERPICVVFNPTIIFRCNFVCSDIICVFIIYFFSPSTFNISLFITVFLTSNHLNIYKTFSFVNSYISIDISNVPAGIIHFFYQVYFIAKIGFIFNIIGKAFM